MQSARWYRNIKVCGDRQLGLYTIDSRWFTCSGYFIRKPKKKKNKLKGNHGRVLFTTFFFTNEPKAGVYSSNNSRLKPKKNEEGVDHEISHIRGLLYVHEKNPQKRLTVGLGRLFLSHISIVWLFVSCVNTLEESNRRLFLFFFGRIEWRHTGLDNLLQKKMKNTKKIFSGGSSVMEGIFVFFAL